MARAADRRRGRNGRDSPGASTCPPSPGRPNGSGRLPDRPGAADHAGTAARSPLLAHHPEAAALPAEELPALHLAVARALGPGIEAVIADHVAFDTPLVLEGGSLLPTLATQRRLVRAVFLYEPDEAQIVRNFGQHEPEAGEQTKRARVSWLFGKWLREDAGKYDVAALPARPWETLLQRTLATLPDDLTTVRTG